MVDVDQEYYEPNVIVIDANDLDNHNQPKRDFHHLVGQDINDSDGSEYSPEKSDSQFDPLGLSVSDSTESDVSSTVLSLYAYTNFLSIFLSI